MDDLAFLHTSALHVQTFTTLATELAPEMQVCHVVDPDLLDEARRWGPTPALGERVRAAMGRAAEGGARVVVCTCSTIGALAEGHYEGFAGLRIDRPMAQAAVRLGSRILVVAALESTLVPTRALLNDAAEMEGRPLMLRELLVADAWKAFEQGDSETYLRLIAAALHRAAPGFDGVVLAQASMAAVVPRCGTLGLPVLSSPRVGVEMAVRLVRNGAVRRD